MKADQEEKKLAKIWVTKQALRYGIYTVERVELDSDGKPVFWSHRFSTDDIHLTEESALARAEIMRTEKIAALRKSIPAIQKKIEALEKKVFVVKT